MKFCLPRRQEVVSEMGEDMIKGTNMKDPIIQCGLEVTFHKAGGC